MSEIAPFIFSAKEFSPENSMFSSNRTLRLLLLSINNKPQIFKNIYINYIQFYLEQSDLC